MRTGQARGGVQGSTMGVPCPSALAPVVAFTVSRDLRHFDQLIAGMEAEFGESWGDLSFAGALDFLARPEAGMLDCLVVAVDAQDGHDPAPVIGVIRAASQRAVGVIVLAAEGGAGVAVLLAGQGVRALLPYPPAEGALHDAIERIQNSVPGPPGSDPFLAGPLVPGAGRGGVILPVQGLAGGLGATSFATALARELAAQPSDAARVCLIDLDLAFGSVATALDLRCTTEVTALLSGLDRAGRDDFARALHPVHDRLQVLTAPPAMVPPDLISPAGMARLLDLAQAQFDFVVIDMPRDITGWTETVLSRAGECFLLLGPDLRSARNLRRFQQALPLAGRAGGGLCHVLARAPDPDDPAARGRVQRIEESLGIRFDLQLPDGGPQLAQADSRGAPLAGVRLPAPLRQKVQALARSLTDARHSAVGAGG